MKKFYLLNLLLCAVFWNSSISQNTDQVSEDSLEVLVNGIWDRIDKYQYDQAIEQSDFLLNLAQDANNLKYVSMAYAQLGHIFLDQKDFARARENYTLGLE
ncbi:MAG: hybrid sensor histidine kinase/response regulator, partial [Gramella sp.]|nr:hybrid sensor histidine kinase/response regulator [Christiangramia sp.]